MYTSLGRYGLLTLTKLLHRDRGSFIALTEELHLHIMGIARYRKLLKEIYGASLVSDEFRKLNNRLENIEEKLNYRAKKSELILSQFSLYDAILNVT